MTSRFHGNNLIKPKQESQDNPLWRTKESAPLPCPLHSKLGCLLFSIGSLNIGTTLRGGDGGGKAIFPRFEVRKT